MFINEELEGFLCCGRNRNKKLQLEENLLLRLDNIESFLAVSMIEDAAEKTQKALSDSRECISKVLPNVAIKTVTASVLISNVHLTQAMWIDQSIVVRYSVPCRQNSF